MRCDCRHTGGLSHDDAGRLRQLLANHLNHVWRTQAADFLVIGQRKMDRPAKTVHLGHQRQCDPNKSLHVATAPSVPAFTSAVERKRVTTPVLPIHRYHIGVPGQYDAAGFKRSDRGNEIRLAAVSTRDPSRVHPVVIKKILNEIDQRQVAVPGNGLETHQVFNYCEAFHKG